MHYMYIITNKLNNKVYVGQTINPNYRWKQHQAYSKQTNTPQYIHRAMAKYGIENFEFSVIAECISLEHANATEIELIIQYNSRDSDKGYNIKPGGQAWDDQMRRYIANKISQFYVDHPEEIERASLQLKQRWADPKFKKQMSLALKGHPTSLKDKSISEEHRLNIIKSVAHLKGVCREPRSDEVKSKISFSKRNASEEQKEQITKSLLNARGQAYLTKEQKDSIIADNRSSYLIAKDYSVNASTIQRIKKKAKNEIQTKRCNG